MTRPAPLPPVEITCSRCGFRWQTSAKGGSTVRCPLPQGGCGHAHKVPRDRPRTAAEAIRQAERAAAIAADTAPGWDDQAPGVLDWPGQLGPECPEAARCSDECGCSSPPIRYTADHAGTVCPECGPGCWEVPPASVDRGRAHVAAATPARTASTPAAQAELDKAARKLERDRATMLDAIGRWRALPTLTLANESDLDWFAAEAAQQSISRARLRELAAQLDATTATFTLPEPERRHWWESSPADLDDDDQDQDDDTGAGPTPEQRALAARHLRQMTGQPEPFRPVAGVLYGPGGVILDAPTGISPAGLAQLREWNRRASGL